MKRFLVFAGSTYYPAGGADDLLHQTDDLTEAIGVAHLPGIGDSLIIHRVRVQHYAFKGEGWPHPPRNAFTDCWAHVYDTLEGKKAWDSRDAQGGE